MDREHAINDRQTRWKHQTSMSIRLTPCRKNVKLYSIMPLFSCHISVRSSAIRTTVLDLSQLGSCDRPWPTHGVNCHMVIIVLGIRRVA